MAKIRIIVIDRHPLICAGVTYAFDAEHDLVVVGQGNSTADAIRLARETSPDVIALDMEIASGSDILKQLLAQCPKVKPLLLAGCDDTEVISSALQNGAWGYVSKWSTIAEVVRAVRCIHAGERYVTPALVAQLFTAAKARCPSESSRFAGLTGREEQILDLLGIGLSNKEIGCRLTISEKTVKHYLTNILGKLNVKNRVQAALLVAGRQDTLNFV